MSSCICTLHSAENQGFHTELVKNWTNMH